MLLVSAAVHVALIALLRAPTPEAEAEAERDWPLPPSLPAKLATPAPPPPQIIEVTWLDDVPTSTPTRVAMASVVTHAHPGAAAAAASESAAGSGAGSAAPSEGTTQGHKMMGMRGPDLHARDEQLAHIANEPGHEGSHVIPSGELANAPNGRMTIDSSVTTVTVDRDGTAHFHDKADFDAHLDVNPVHVARTLKAMGAMIVDAAEESEDMKKWDMVPDLPESKRGINEVCAQYGRDCDTDDLSPKERAAQGRVSSYSEGKAPDHGVGGGGLLSILSGRADLTSYLMRKAGIDPNSSKKLKLLDSTREERAEKGAAYQAEQLAKSDEYMQENLRALWASPLKGDERRALLFTLWDECDEGDSMSGHAG
ncbi:MAG TPA: hypothetical protein VGC41_27550, partial [Kofleriaceae bacterium]